MERGERADAVAGTAASTGKLVSCEGVVLGVLN